MTATHCEGTQRGLAGAVLHRSLTLLFAAAVLPMLVMPSFGADGAVGHEETSVAASPNIDVAAFDTWLSEFRQEALASGVSDATLDAALTNIRPDPRVIELLQSQPEHTRGIWDYLGFAVSDKRIANGLRMLRDHEETLAAIEARYSVPRTVIVAIWGLESSYGTNPGSRSVIPSLATLAFAGGRRAAFGRRQLVAALQILENGHHARQVHGLMGRCHGPYAVHPDDVQRACR